MFEGIIVLVFYSRVINDWCSKAYCFGFLFQGHKRLVLEGIIDFFVKQDALFEIDQKNRFVYGRSYRWEAQEIYSELILYDDSR